MRGLKKYVGMINEVFSDKIIKCSEVVDKLNNIFINNTPNIIFSTNRYPSSEKYNNIIVNARYSQKIYGFDEYVEVFLGFPKYRKVLILNNEELNHIKLKIIETIVHELRHRHQYKIRKNKHYDTRYKVSFETTKKIKEMMEYLGEEDEIDAYAYETIVNSKYGNLTKDDLRNFDQIDIYKSESVYLYNKFFRYADEKIWRKFIKKVYKYAEF